MNEGTVVRYHGRAMRHVVGIETAWTWCSRSVRSMHPIDTSEAPDDFPTCVYCIGWRWIWRFS